MWPKIKIQRLIARTLQLILMMQNFGNENILYGGMGWVWVFQGIHRGIRDAFPIPLQDMKREMLILPVSDNFNVGSAVIFNCWRFYDRINEHNFTHLSINH
ncbi:hypothetical protein RF11_14032 [Thelohanellus kitauei]|uniref:Uncharacterized protein n=1 Tax=Thelohanellus kitauei TaxID=669202 RepID=A0A0C2J448_THEKT|nr:hypothetical protein RF11_14032 [Thelohanellus kitauei]